MLGCEIGFSELMRAGQIERTPRIFAAQPANCAPIAAAFMAGGDPFAREPASRIWGAVHAVAQAPTGDAMKLSRDKVSDISHKLVDMLMEVEGLQHLVYQAAWMMSAGADCATEVAMAKVKANEVFQRVALDGVKIHGAIGFSVEHDMGLYYRRVLASKFIPYDSGHYLEKVAEGLGL